MTETSHRRQSLLIGLCLAAAIVAVYWPVQRFEFINCDDDDYVTENAAVQGGLTWGGVGWALTTRQAGNWHPLTWVSHMVDCQVFGQNAGAHHVVNVVWHVANTLLLFGVLARMTGAVWRSGWVAGLFALHPLHVESVAWVAERKDVLSTWLWLLTLWAYVRYVARPSRGRYAVTLGLYALGLMAKPMLVTLPCALLLLDYWPLGRTRWVKPVMGKPAPHPIPRLRDHPLPRSEQGRGQGEGVAVHGESGKIPLARLVWEKVPFFVLAVVSCVLTLWAQGSGGAVVPLGALSLGARVANAVVAYAGYLGKAIWPGGLAVFYPYQTQPLVTVVGAAALLVVVSGVVMVQWRRRPHWLVGWLWYVGTLVPVIGLVQVGGQAMADRYTYMPLVGVMMMVAWTVSGAVEGRRVLKGLVAVAGVLSLVAGAVLSSLQLRHWENSEQLSRHALEVTSGNFLAHNNLGYVLATQGEAAAAVSQFAAALKINPAYAAAHNNLGYVLAEQGRLAEAVVEYQAALQIKPDYADAHNNLGNALAQQGKLAEAIAEYQTALRLDSNRVEARYNLAHVFATQGRLTEALAEYRAAVQTNPDSAEARYNLADFLAAQGETQGALAQFRELLRRHPGWPLALGRLAWIQATHANATFRNAAEAVPLAEQLCAITGNQQADALDVLAAAYAEAGRFAEAQRTAQKALALAEAAGQRELAVQIQDRLKLYQVGRPYHE